MDNPEPAEYVSIASVGQWRGRVDKTLEVLEKSSSATELAVQNLQTQVTRLVVIAGLGLFFGNVITSILVGLLIRKLSAP